jgi:serine/threonine protein kinase
MFEDLKNHIFDFSSQLNYFLSLRKDETISFSEVFEINSFIKKCHDLIEEKKQIFLSPFSSLVPAALSSLSSTSASFSASVSTIPSVKRSSMFLDKDTRFLYHLSVAENQKLQFPKEEAMRKDKLMRLVLLPQDIRLTDQSFCQGCFGMVDIGLFHGKAEVAVKTFRNNSTNHQLTEQENHLIENEILLLSYLKHSNIVGIYGIIHNSYQISAVLELSKLGTLEEFLSSSSSSGFPPSLLISWFVDIASALECIHRKHVKHGNLSPGNIMIFPSLYLKLSGFKLLPHSSSSSTPSDSFLSTTTSRSEDDAFVAPEVRIHQLHPHFASDIYSFAITVVHSITRKKPLLETNIQDQIAAAVAVLTESSSPSCVSSSHLLLLQRFQSFLLNCIEYDPSIHPNALRPTAATILFEVQQLLSAYGNDSRKINETLIETLEKEILQSREEKPLEEQKKPLSPSPSASSLLFPYFSTPIVASEENKPLRDLTPEEAMTVLTKLGFKPDSLSSDATSLQIDEIDGELLDIIESVSECAEIGINKPIHLMKRFLKKLDELRDLGVPKVLYFCEEEEREREEKESKKKIAEVDDASKTLLEEKQEKEKQLERIFSEESWERGDNNESEDDEEEDEVVNKSSPSPVRSKSPEVDFLSNPATATSLPSTSTPIPSHLQHFSDSDDLVNDEFLTKILDSHQPSDSSDTSFPHVAILFSPMDMKECRVLSFPASSRLAGVPFDVVVISKLFLLSSDECWNEVHHRNKLETCLSGLSLDLKKIIVYGDKELMESLLRAEVSTNRKKDDGKEDFKAKKSPIIPNQNDGIHLPTCLQRRNSLVSKVLKVKYQERLKNGPDIASFTGHRLVRKYGMWSDNNEKMKDYQFATTAFNKVEVELSKRYLGDKQKKELKNLEEKEKKKTEKKRENASKESERERNKTEGEKRKRERQFKRRKTHSHSELQNSDEKGLIKEEVKSEEKESNVLWTTEDKKKEQVGASDANNVEATTEEVTESAETVPVRESGLLTLILFLKLLFFTKRKKFPFATTLSMLDSLLKPFHRNISLYRNYEFYGMKRPSWKSLKKKERLAAVETEEKEKEEGAHIDIFYSQHKRLSGFTDYQMIGFSSSYEVQKIDRVGDLLQCWERKEGQPSYCSPYIYDASSFKPCRSYRSILFEIISPMKVTSSPMKYITSTLPTLPTSRSLLASTLFYDTRFPLTSSSSSKKKKSKSSNKQQDSSFLSSCLNRKDSTHLLDWEELQYTSPLIMTADPNRLNGFDQWNEENIEMTIENLQTMIRFLQSQQEKGLLILSNSIDYEATLNQYQSLLSVLTGNNSGKEEFLSSAVVTGIKREKLQIWCEKVREIEDDDNEYQEKEHVEMRERKEKREENRSRKRNALLENCPESSVLLPLVPSFREEIIVTDEFDYEKFPLRNRCRELLNILLRKVGMINSINSSSSNNSSRSGESKTLLYYGNQWNVFLSVDLFNILKKILTLLYSNEFGKKERFFFSYTRCLKEKKEEEENGKQKMSSFSASSSLLITKEDIIRFINLTFLEKNGSTADGHNRIKQPLSVNLLSSFPSSDSRTKEEEELVEKETVKLFEMLLEIWETKYLSGTLFHSCSVATTMVASYEVTDFFYYSSFITSLFQQYSAFIEDALLPSFFSTEATTSSFSSEDQLLLEKKLKCLLRQQLIRLFVKEIQAFIQQFQDFFLVYSSRFLSPFDEQSNSRRKKKQKNQKEKRRDVKKGRTTPSKGIAEVVDPETEGNETGKEKYDETASKLMFERSNHQLSIETILQERNENDFLSLILYNLSYCLSSEFSLFLQATSRNKKYVFFCEAFSFFVSIFPEPSGDDAVDRKVIAGSSSVKDELLTSFHSIWKEWKTWKSFFFPEKSLNVIELLKAMSCCFYFKQFFLSYMKSSSSTVMNLLSGGFLSSPASLSLAPSSISLRSSSVVAVGGCTSGLSAFLTRFPGIPQFFFRSRWHYGASLMTFTAISPASSSSNLNPVTTIVKRLEAFDEFDCFVYPLRNEIRQKLNILLRKCQLHLYYKRNWQRFLKEDSLFLLKKVISVMFAFELHVKFLFLSDYRQFEDKKEKESVQFISSIDDLLTFVQMKYDEEVISSSLVVESSVTKIAVKNKVASVLLKKDLLLKAFQPAKKEGKPLPFMATTEELEKEIIKLLTMCEEVWERRNETGKILPHSSHLPITERKREIKDSFIFDYFYFTSSILIFSQKLSTAVHHHLLSTFFPKSIITPSEETYSTSNDVLIEKKIQNTILSYFEKQCYEKIKFFIHLLIMFINEMDLMYPFIPFMDDIPTLVVETSRSEETLVTEERDSFAKERNGFRCYYAYHDGSGEAMKKRNLEMFRKRETRKKQKVINEAKQQGSLQSSEQPISLKTVNLEKIQKERDLKEMIKLIQANLHTKVLSTSFTTDKEKEKEKEKTKKWKIFESAISAFQKTKGKKVEEEAESSCRTHLKRWNEWAFLSLCSASVSSSVVSSSTADVSLSLVQHLKLVAFSYLFESFFVSFLSSCLMHPLSSLTIHSNVSPFLPFLLPYIHRLRLLHGVSLLSISTEKKGKGKDTSHKILVKKLEMLDDFEMLRYPLRYEAKHLLNDLLVTSAYSLCCEKSWKLFMKNHICRLLIKILYRWYGYEGGSICHVASSVTHHSLSTTVPTPAVIPVVTSSAVASSHNRFKQFHKKLQKKEDLLDYINEKYQHESFLFSRLQQKRIQEKASNTIRRQELVTAPEQPLLSEAELIDKKKLLIIITTQQVEGESGEKLTVRRRSVGTSSSVSNSGSAGSSSSSSNPSNNEMEVEVLKVMKIMKRIHEMKSALRTVPLFKNNLSFSHYTVLSYEFSYFFTTSHIKQLYFKKIEEIKKRIFPKIIKKYQILFNTLQPYCSLSKLDIQPNKPRTGRDGVQTINGSLSSLEAQQDGVREEKGEINQQNQEEKTKQQILLYLEETLLIKNKPYLLKSHIFKKMKKYLLSSIQMLILKFKQFLTASFHQIIPFKVVKEGKKEKLVIIDSFCKKAKKDCIDYNHLMEKVQKGDEKEMFTCIALSMKHLQKREPFSSTLALYEKYWEINKEYVYSSYCNHLKEWKMWMKQQSTLSGGGAAAAAAAASHSCLFALFSSFSNGCSLSPSHALDFYRIGCYCFYFDLFIKEYACSFLSSEKIEKYMDTYCQFIKRSYESRLEMDLMKQGCNTSNTFSWKEYQEQLKHYPRISIPLFGVLEEEDRERKRTNKKVFIGIPKFFLRSSYHHSYYSSFLQIHERNQFLLSLFSKLSSHNLTSTIQQIENLPFLSSPPSFVRRLKERQYVKPSPGKKRKYVKQRKSTIESNEERDEQKQEQKNEKKETTAFLMSFLPQVISQKEQDLIDQEAKECHQKKIQELINNCYQLVKKRNL